MKKIFKNCSIYRKSKGLYIFGYLRTPYGGVGLPPATNLPMAAPTADIGGTVLRIFRELSGEVENVDLAIAATSFRAHLKDLGFKTAAAFEKDATVVNVEFNGDFYSIISTQKDPHGANLHTGSKKLAPTATEEEIGCAVLAILNNTH